MLEDDFPLCWDNFTRNSILSASCTPEKTMPLYLLLCYFFLSWLLILSFPALYVLPASAIKGVHGGGWDVPGGRDPGDQSDQGPQAAPHAPISRVDGSHPYYPAAPLNPALATEPNPSCWRHSGKRPWYDLPTFAERLLTELDFFFFRNGNHAIVYI